MSHLQLTIYVNETDLHGEVSLHEAVIRRLLHLGIAGATVERGFMGYGKHHQVHRQRLFGVSDDHAIVIIAVDEESKIRTILPEVRKLVKDGLMTLHPVEIVA